jgi:hypothetical protein
MLVLPMYWLVIMSWGVHPHEWVKGIRKEAAYSVSCTCPFAFLPCGHTVYLSLEDASFKPHLRSKVQPWSWTSSLQNCETYVSSPYKLPSCLYSVLVAQTKMLPTLLWVLPLEKPMRFSWWILEKDASMLLAGAGGKEIISNHAREFCSVSKICPQEQLFKWNLTCLWP